MQRGLQLLRGRYHLQLWSLKHACLTLSATCAWHPPMLGISLNQHVGGTHYQPDPNELELAENSCILHFANADVDCFVITQYLGALSVWGHAIQIIVVFKLSICSWATLGLAAEKNNLTWIISSGPFQSHEVHQMAFAQSSRNCRNFHFFLSTLKWL